MQTYLMRLSADQIVKEARDWPDGAAANLVDRIMRAQYGHADPPIENAWRHEIEHRVAAIESGTVQGIPLDETLAKTHKKFDLPKPTAPD